MPKIVWDLAHNPLDTSIPKVILKIPVMCPAQVGYNIKPGHSTLYGAAQVYVDLLVLCTKDEREDGYSPGWWGYPGAAYRLRYHHQVMVQQGKWKIHVWGGGAFEGSRNRAFTDDAYLMISAPWGSF